MKRADILNKLRALTKAGKPIVGSGAGTGLSAKCEEMGGSDLIIVYNSGRYRMAGRMATAGNFAYGDANSIVMEMAHEILPVVKHTPVIAGVNGTDPFKVMPYFLKQIKDIGFAGVQNYPTVGNFDGRMRANMEAGGLGYDKEVAVIALAHDMDLLTTPYVFTEDETKAMLGAGADILVAHVGLTASAGVGAACAMNLDEAIERVMCIAETAWSIQRDALVLCHGGPFDEPETVNAALKRMPGIAGFYGASACERLPVERAIVDQMQKFKAMTLA